MIIAKRNYFYCIFFILSGMWIILLSCAGSRQERIQTIKTEPPPPQSQVSIPQDAPDYTPRMLKERQPKGNIAIWPFRFGTRKELDVEIGGIWLIKAYEEYETNNEAMLVTSSVTEVFVNDLMKTYKVIERDQFKSVLAENKVDLSGISGPEVAVKLGYLIGAQYLVVGSCLPGVNRNELTVEMKLLEVTKKGETLRAATGTCVRCSSEKLRMLSKELAWKLLSPYPQWEMPGEQMLPGAK